MKCQPRQLHRKANWTGLNHLLMQAGTVEPAKQQILITLVHFTDKLHKLWEVCVFHSQWFLTQSKRASLAHFHPLFGLFLSSCSRCLCPWILNRLSLTAVVRNNSHSHWLELSCQYLKAEKAEGQGFGELIWLPMKIDTASGNEDYFAPANST